MSFFSTTEGPDLSRLDRSAQTWPTPTGAQRGLWLVEFDRGSQRFLYSDMDVTDRLTPSQKRAFPSYDPTADLNAAADADLLAREGRIATPGSTDVLGLFVEGVSDDLDAAKRNLPAVGQGLKTLLIAAAVVVVAYIAWQIVKQLKP